VLALSNGPDGQGAIEPLASFRTNPAGAAIVSALGPIRRVMQGGGRAERRYLVIVRGTPDRPGEVVQVQVRN